MCNYCQNKSNCSDCNYTKAFDHIIDLNINNKTEKKETRKIWDTQCNHYKEKDYNFCKYCGKLDFCVPCHNCDLKIITTNEKGSVNIKHDCLNCNYLSAKNKKFIDLKKDKDTQT